MDKLERAQIRLLLDHLAADRREKASLRNKEMHAAHSAKRTLQSGATVRAAIRIAEELATAYVTDIVAAVSDVAKDTEAFNMMSADVTIMFEDMQPNIDQAVKLGTAGSSDGQRFESVGNEANRLFRDVQAKTMRLLEIHRFSFIRPSPNDSKALSKRLAPLPIIAAQKNKGGKPLAPHWDEMWSSIAVMLWQGDLQPKTQADISNAMLDWFSQAEIEIGETAVRARARQLWLKYEAAILAK